MKNAFEYLYSPKNGLLFLLNGFKFLVILTLCKPCYF